MKPVLLLMVVAAGCVVASDHHHHAQPRRGSLVPVPRSAVTPTVEPPPGPPPNIIDGRPAKQEYFPFQAAITIDSHYFCSGSLITRRHVLTGAQCAYDGREFIVYLGVSLLYTPESGHLVIVTLSKVVHGNYRPGVLGNDIALIGLTRDVVYNQFIRSIAPATGSSLYVGRRSSASGWGRTSSSSDLSDRLQYINLTVISNAECGSKYGLSLPSTVLCTSTSTGGGTCYGDSGDPLIDITSGVQIGIASFGPSGCAPHYPDGFTRLTSYASWIRAHTAGTHHSHDSGNTYNSVTTNNFRNTYNSGSEEGFSTALLAAGNALFWITLSLY